MHDGVLVARHILPHKVDDLVIILMGTAQLFPRCRILYFCLLRLDAGVSVTVAEVEVGLFSIALETDGVGIDAV